MSKSFEEAIAEGVAAIQAAVNPYESQMTDAVATAEPGPPAPSGELAAPPADGEPA